MSGGRVVKDCPSLDEMPGRAEQLQQLREEVTLFADGVQEARACVALLVEETRTLQRRVAECCERTAQQQRRRIQLDERVRGVTDITLRQVGEVRRFQVCVDTFLATPGDTGSPSTPAGQGTRPSEGLRSVARQRVSLPQGGAAESPDLPRYTPAISSTSGDQIVDSYVTTDQEV